MLEPMAIRVPTNFYVHFVTILTRLCRRKFFFLQCNEDTYFEEADNDLVDEIAESPRVVSNSFFSKPFLLVILKGHCPWYKD